MEPRTVSRVIVLDPQGRLLLLHASDLCTPPQDWWELPGGGREPGESAADAARRELWEETGIAVEDVGRCLACVEVEGRFADRRFRQLESIFLVRLEGVVACRPVALQGELERRAHLGHGWWRLADALAAGLRLHPPQLAELATPLLEPTATAPSAPGALRPAPCG